MPFADSGGRTWSMRSASAAAASSPGCWLDQYCMTMAMAADPQPAFTWWTNGTSSHDPPAEDASEYNPMRKRAALARSTRLSRENKTALRRCRAARRERGNLVMAYGDCTTQRSEVQNPAEGNDFIPPEPSRKGSSCYFVSPAVRTYIEICQRQKEWWL